jgi:hypothetical protein
MTAALKKSTNSNASTGLPKNISMFQNKKPHKFYEELFLISKQISKITLALTIYDK